MGKQVFNKFQESKEEIEENKNYEDMIMSSSSWKISEKVDDHHLNQIISSSSSSVDSAKEGSDFSSSCCSFSSSDFMEDASSSSSPSSSSSSSNGPLYQLSDLMDQLPIKRGLSKFYQGKSESFATLASVENLEDLVKKENPYKKRIKLCKSYCGGLENGHKFTSPKSSISKKSLSHKNNTFSISSSNLRRNCSNSFMAKFKSPIHVQKDF